MNDRTLRRFAREQQTGNRSLMRQLEEFGRVRLSTNFFMRDFLYSEICAANGIANIPEDPELAIRAGKGLSENLLEPLHEAFGQVAIRSAYRSPTVNAFGHRHGLGCGSNEFNRAKHIWDRLDEEGCMGATACIVIPWFIDTEGYRETGDWEPLAWFIHDNLPYSEMCFLATANAAFNLNWRDGKPKREIFRIRPRGFLTRPGMPNNESDHSYRYPEFPKI